MGGGLGVFNRKFKFTGMYRISFFSYLLFDFCNKTLFALQYSLTVLMTLIGVEGGGAGYAIFIKLIIMFHFMCVFVLMIQLVVYYYVYGPHGRTESFC